MRHAGWAVLAAALLLSRSASAEEVSLTVPVIVPITGLLALEGTSQLNGANLAIAHAPPGLQIKGQTIDSGTTAEGGANALERVAGDKNIDFVVAPLFGTQVLAMLPVALEYKMPILAPTGTGPVTEQGNPYMFRLYPSDAISKAAHIRYVIDEMKLKKAAILYNTTGYGQSGFKYMSEYIAKAGGEVVFSEGIDLSTKEISATVAKLKASQSGRHPHPDAQRLDRDGRQAARSGGPAHTGRRQHHDRDAGNGVVAAAIGLEGCLR